MNGPGHGTDFLCPNGTLFNQEVLACDWWMNVECSASDKYFSKNDAIGHLSSGASMMREVMKMLLRPMSYPPAPAAYGQPSMDFHYQLVNEQLPPYEQGPPPALNVIGIPTQAHSQTNGYDSSTRKYYTPTIPTTQYTSSEYSGGQTSYTRNPAVQQSTQFTSGKQQTYTTSQFAQGQQNTYQTPQVTQNTRTQYNTQQTYNTNPTLTNQYTGTQTQSFATNKPATHSYTNRQNTVISNSQQKYTYPINKASEDQINIRFDSSDSAQGSVDYSTVSPNIEVPSRTYSLPKLPSMEGFGTSTSTPDIFTTNEPDILIRFPSTTTDNDLSENNQNNLSGTPSTSNTLNVQSDVTLSTTAIPYTNGDAELTPPSFSSAANDNSAFNTQSPAVDLTFQSQLGNSAPATTESQMNFIATTPASAIGSDAGFVTESNDNSQSIDLSDRFVTSQSPCSSSNDEPGCISVSTMKPFVDESAIADADATTPPPVDVRIDTSLDLSSNDLNGNQYSTTSSSNVGFVVQNNVQSSKTASKENSSFTSDTEYNYPIPNAPSSQNTASIANISSLEYLPALQVNNAVDEASKYTILDSPPAVAYPVFDVSSINSLPSKPNNQLTEPENMDNQNTQTFDDSNNSNSFNNNEGDVSSNTIIQSSTTVSSASGQTTSAENEQSNDLINIRFDDSKPDVTNFASNQQGTQNYHQDVRQNLGAKPAVQTTVFNQLSHVQYQQQLPISNAQAFRPATHGLVGTSQGGSFATSHYNTQNDQPQKQSFTGQSYNQRFPSGGTTYNSFTQQSPYKNDFGSSSSATGTQGGYSTPHQHSKSQYTSGKTVVEFVPSLGFSLDLENERQGYLDALKKGLFSTDGAKAGGNYNLDQLNSGGNFDFSGSHSQYNTPQLGLSDVKHTGYSGFTSYQSPISSIGVLNGAHVTRNQNAFQATGGRFEGYSRNKPNVPFSF